MVVHESDQVQNKTRVSDASRIYAADDRPSAAERPSIVRIGLVSETVALSQPRGGVVAGVHGGIAARVFHGEQVVAAIIGVTGTNIGAPGNCRRRRVDTRSSRG